MKRFPILIAVMAVLVAMGVTSCKTTEDNYRKAVTYFHDWYAEGLMDVEMFSQDTNLSLIHI